MNQNRYEIVIYFKDNCPPIKERVKNLKECVNYWKMIDDTVSDAYLVDWNGQMIKIYHAL